jgi:F0F1-type ATP synthase membrane subunit b/b'
VAKLSIAIAEKVIRKELSTDDAQKALVDKLLNEVKEL